MPSFITHTVVALCAGKAVYARPMPARFWVLAVTCSVAPDFDVGFHTLGADWGSFWGHRGFTHSLLFAVLLGFAVPTLFLRGLARPPTRSWWGLVAFFFALTASHGLIDGLTDGGPGIALFEPFSDARIFWPWRPLDVAPISLDGALSNRFVRVLLDEARWVWLPAVALMLGVIAVRRVLRSRREKSEKEVPTT